MRAEPTFTRTTTQRTKRHRDCHTRGISVTSAVDAGDVTGPLLWLSCDCCRAVPASLPASSTSHCFPFSFRSLFLVLLFWAVFCVSSLFVSCRCFRVAFRRLAVSGLLSVRCRRSHTKPVRLECPFCSCRFEVSHIPRDVGPGPLEREPVLLEELGAPAG